MEINKKQWVYLIQEALLILVFSYLVFFASTHNGLVDLTMLTISAVLFTGLGIFWLFRGFPRRSPVEWSLLAMLAALLLTSFTSIDPRRSLSEYWLISISILLFIAISDFTHRGLPQELVVKVILIIGSLMMALAWVEVFQWYLGWVSTTGSWLPSLNYRLSLPNFYGVILNVLLMFGLARLLKTPQTIGRIFLILFCLSDLGMLYLTSSRGSWVGTLAGLGTFLLIILAEYKLQFLKLWKFLKGKKIIFIALILVSVFSLTTVGWLLYRQTLHPSHNASLSDARSYLWEPAWQAFLRSPIVGEGPFTYISQYLGSKSVPPYDLFVYSHNIYLDLLSGSGIVGFIIFIWLLVSVGRFLFERLRAVTGLARAVIIGAISSLIAFFVHGFFDSVHHTIPTSAWILSLLVGAAFYKPSQSDKKPGISFLSLAVLVSVVLLGWLNIWTTIPYQKGVAAANMGNFKEAESEFQQAAQRDPRLAVAHQQLGLVMSMEAENNVQGALDGAISAFEEAVRLDPHWAMNNANLAALYRAKGDMSNAKIYFQKSIEAAQYCTICWLNMAYTLELSGENTTAKAAYLNTLELQPDWANAYFWRSSSLRKDVFTQWQTQNNVSGLPDIETLENNLKATPDLPLPYLQLASALLDRNRLDEAEKLVNQASLTFFNNEAEQLEYKWLQAELAYAKGNPLEAVQFGRQAIDEVQAQGMNGAGTLGKTMYVPLMFRRQAIGWEIVPQLTVIPLTDLWGVRMNRLVEWLHKTGDDALAEQYHSELVRIIPDIDEVLKTNQP